MTDPRERHARVKRVFLDACDIPSEDRSAFLERTCGDDVELRGEVEALLVHHRESTATDRTGDPAVALVDPSQDTVTGTEDPESRQGAGRFEPGRVLLDRYRIVSLLGRGGMGEVYRADDLMLGQSVALKFLPETLAASPRRLARFRDEARISREVTHANVCRVHDIGLVDGQHFISMEYVDGDDLATLLRRIGRVPPEKATQIAAQLCAGIAAAHAKGVLHRDLKPANVMVDSRGRVRITDFGIASFVGREGGPSRRAGTPAYMAPELLRGVDPSVHSDLYSLGLVLYELFTGEPVFHAKSVAEAERMHLGETPSRPSSLVADIDPAVERAILRCLEKDPADRPRSALALAAALPGGDPLAAALAAGEVPSPEMVAAAGAASVDHAPAGRALFVACLVVLALAVPVVEWAFPAERAKVPRSPRVLAEKAREMLAGFGFVDEPADTSYGFWTQPFRPGYVEGDEDDVAFLPRNDPGPVQFWYRESDHDLIPTHALNVVLGTAKTSTDDPPFDEGMVEIWLDHERRLLHLVAQVDVETGTDVETEPPHDGTPDDPPAPPPDFAALFAAAGLDYEKFEHDEDFTPQDVEFEMPLGWSGPAADGSGRTVEVFAEYTDGRIVHFHVADAEYDGGEPGAVAGFSALLYTGTLHNLAWILLILVAGPLAWVNLRRGLGDRRGAFRLAAVVFGAHLVGWALSGTHASDLQAQIGLLTFATAAALYNAAIVWAFYVALEPYVRRFLPHSLISWGRVLSGRPGDPLVGRHVLIGTLTGGCWAILVGLDAVLPGQLGLVGTVSELGAVDPDTLLGPRDWVATAIAFGFEAVYEGLIFLFVLVVLRAVVRNIRVASVLTVLVVTPKFALAGGHVWLSAVLLGLGGVAVGSWLLIRYGAVTVCTALFVSYLLISYPVTTRWSAWYADAGLFAVAVCALLAVHGFRAAGRRRRGGARG